MENIDVITLSRTTIIVFAALVVLLFIFKIIKKGFWIWILILGTTGAITFVDPVKIQTIAEDFKTTYVQQIIDYFKPALDFYDPGDKYEGLESEFMDKFNEYESILNDTEQEKTE